MNWNQQQGNQRPQQVNPQFQQFGQQQTNPQQGFNLANLQQLLQQQQQTQQNPQFAATPSPQYVANQQRRDPRQDSSQGVNLMQQLIGQLQQQPTAAVTPQVSQGNPTQGNQLQQLLLMQQLQQQQQQQQQQTGVNQLLNTLNMPPQQLTHLQQQQQLLQKLSQLQKGPQTATPGATTTSADQIRQALLQMQPQTTPAPQSTYQAPPSTNFPPQQYSAPPQQQYSAPPPQPQNFPNAPTQFPQRRFDDQFDRKGERFPEGPRGRGRDDRGPRNVPDRGPVAPQRRRSPPAMRRRSPPRHDKKRRSRSPVHKRSKSPDRKKSKSPDRKRSKSPKRSKSRSPARDTKTRDRTPEEKEKKYSTVIPTGSFVEYQRDFLNIKRRYSRLQISDDFTHVVATYLHTDQRISVEPPYIYTDYITPKESKQQDQPILGDMYSPTGKTYNVKVMIMGNEQKSTGTHLVNTLKFIVAKEDRSDLMCVGGFWSQSKDGGNPDLDESCLVRCATRWAKDWLSVDLSLVKKWTRFMEIHYARGDHTEITVIFVPELQEIVPTQQEFEELWESRQKAKRERKNPPVEAASTEEPGEIKQEPEVKVEVKKKDPKPSGVLVTSSKPECVMISLDGLLDYNESDKHEKTFEVSLFSEMFYEMLCRDYANVILAALEAEKKRRRVEEEESEDKEQVAKKVKVEEEPAVETPPPEIKAEPVAEIKQEPISEQAPTESGEMQVESETPEEAPTETPVPEPAPVAEVAEPKKEKTTVVDQELLKAFAFFDRNLVGYIRLDDFETILHSLGRNFSRAFVKQLLSKFEVNKKVMWKKLTEREIE